MKKSSIALLIAITGLFLCFTVVNLKLKSEYSKGHIQSPMKTNILSEFHHIKELNALSSKVNDYQRNILIYQQKDSNALVHDYYTPAGVNYFVQNDTLFIEHDSTYVQNGYDIKIYCKNLESLNASRSFITLVNYSSDSISLTSSVNASINCVHIQSNYISMNISDESSIAISAIDTINKADIYIQNNGYLNASNIYFKEKKLTIKNNGSVRASGQSLKNFGIITDIKN
ncbi:MAG: hypothetical protein EAZ12_03220 [Sphingobacteriia bacterium]|nr:MAG: hypothetical protein EAZ12_03220 [Sphingobacteriia bacterium]